MSFQKAVVVALSLLLAPLAFADSVYVEDATGSGVSSADLQTATELVRGSVSESGSNLAAQPQAGFTLRPKLMKLGDAYVLSLAKVKGGQVVYSSQLKASRMEELDRVAQTLTATVIHEQKPEAASGQSQESQPKKEAHRVVNLGFGGALFNNLSNNSLGFSVGGGYGWDTDRVTIKLMSEFALAGSAFMASESLGLNLYILPTDVSPYVSADFGGGLARSDTKDILGGLVGGFVAGAGAGLEVLRNSTVNLDLGFRAGFLLNPNAIGLPMAFTLRLGLFF